MSEPLAEALKYKEGDTLTLPTPAGPQELRIAGVFYDYRTDGPIVWMDITQFRRFWQDEHLKAGGIREPELAAGRPVRGHGVHRVDHAVADAEQRGNARAEPHAVGREGDDELPAGARIRRHPVSDILGYRHILWFTGYPYASTFTGANETAVRAYLDAGGNFFLSSQDYLYDAGLTSFGQNYLHISTYTNDVKHTTVTGQNVFSGLGPYSLSYPCTNYSDRVTPDGQAQLAFSGNQGNAAVSFNGVDFNTVFLGYPFEAIQNLAGRTAVMERTLDFFGGCEPPDEPIEGLVAMNDSPTILGDSTTFTATVSGSDASSVADPALARLHGGMMQPLFMTSFGSKARFRRSRM